MEEMVTFNALQQSYEGKKVFLTGHTGFKGSWLLKTLHLLGAEVKGYALAPETAEDLYYLIDGDSLCDSVIADIRDKEKVVSEVITFQPDFIFHLSAQPLVRLSYEIPSETFDVNALGTAYLLDAIRVLEKKCSIVLITTDKVYHNNEWEFPYREVDRLGGYDPYSASKACAELIIDSYRNSFFNLQKFNQHQKAIAVARAGNVIGGGDWSKDRLIPDIVKSLRNENTVIIRNPNSVRPWQHVMEPIKGYLMLGNKLSTDPLRFSEAYNFGPYVENVNNVKTIVDLILASWGNGEIVVQHNESSPHESSLLKLDISKATTTLGWKPILSTNEALDFTLKWYKKFFEEPNSINQFVEDQIYAFFKKSSYEY
jgi:CDP-glucose 4,6-dehydratase